MDLRFKLYAADPSCIQCLNMCVVLVFCVLCSCTSTTHICYMLLWSCELVPFIAEAMKIIIAYL